MLLGVDTDPSPCSPDITSSVCTVWSERPANQAHIEDLRTKMSAAQAEVLVFLGAGLSFGAARLGSRTYFDNERWLSKPLPNFDKKGGKDSRGDRGRPPKRGGNGDPPGFMAICFDDDGQPFPSWPWLVSRMRHRLALEEPAEKQQAISDFFADAGPLDCAQYFRNTVGEANYEHFLKKNFAPAWEGDRFITPSHQALAELRLQTIFTSNYDELIEHTYTRMGRSLRVSRDAEQFRAGLRSEDAAHLVKLHGCISDPRSIVLTRDDYAAARVERARIYDDLAGRLDSSTFLFVGFSLTDPNLTAILDDVRFAARGRVPVSYSVQARFDPVRNEYLRSRGINVIWLDSWNELPGFLGALSPETTGSS